MGADQGQAGREERGHTRLEGLINALIELVAATVHVIATGPSNCSVISVTWLLYLYIDESCGSLFFLVLFYLESNFSFFTKEKLRKEDGIISFHRHFLRT